MDDCRIANSCRLNSFRHCRLRLSTILVFVCQLCREVSECMHYTFDTEFRKEFRKELQEKWLHLSKGSCERGLARKYRIRATFQNTILKDWETANSISFFHSFRDRILRKSKESKWCPRKESCHRLSLHTSSVVSEKVFRQFLYLAVRIDWRDARQHPSASVGCGVMLKSKTL